MKKHFAYSILAIIVLLMIMISTSFAQLPIGFTNMYGQSVPFEASPTTHTTNKISTTLTAPTNAYDTDWSPYSAPTQMAVYGNTVTDYSIRYFQLESFTNPMDPTAWTPGWVDIKIRWASPTTTNDKYRITYRVAPDTTDYELVGWTWGAAALVNVGAETIAETWSQQPEPNDGIWDWTDVTNIQIRFETQQVTTQDIGKKVAIYEVWVSVYPWPLPPESSTAISIQPSPLFGVATWWYFFVDVYMMGLTGPGLGTYQVIFSYDTNVLTAFEYYTYAPFINMLPSGIDDEAGTVSVAALTFLGDTVGFERGKTPLCRIYFTVDAPGYSPLTFSFGELKQVGIDPIYPPLYDGVVGTPSFMSLTTGMLPPPPYDPTGTNWHEIFPIRSNNWVLTTWTDNGDGYLSASDQIELTNATNWLYWFHVDIVTVTIHFTFKPGLTDPGEAEPEIPELEMPPALGSRWHMIYPDYCRTFTITSHEDTDGDTYLDPSEQFDFEFDDDPGVPVWAHLDSVTTDIWISQKGEPEPGGIPEFPLGIGLAMSLVALIPVIYVWRTRPKKKVE